MSWNTLVKRMVTTGISLLGVGMLVLFAEGCTTSAMFPQSLYPLERINIMSGLDSYEGMILQAYDSVEVHSSSIILRPGSRVAIRTEQTTQWLGQFECKIRSGSGMTAYLRTVSNDFDTSKGIAFRYSTDGCSIRRPNGEMIPLDYNADGSQQTLSFYNEADLLQISAGCKKLYQEDATLPETEYIIFEPLPNSIVEIVGINYFETNVE